MVLCIDVCLGEEWGRESTNCFRHSGKTKGSSTWHGQAGPVGRNHQGDDHEQRQEKKTYEHRVQMDHVCTSERMLSRGHMNRPGKGKIDASPRRSQPHPPPRRVKSDRAQPKGHVAVGSTGQSRGNQVSEEP